MCHQDITPLLPLENIANAQAAESPLDAFEIEDLSLRLDAKQRELLRRILDVVNQPFPSTKAAQAEWLTKVVAAVEALIQALETMVDSQRVRDRLQLELNELKNRLGPNRPRQPSVKSIQARIVNTLQILDSPGKPSPTPPRRPFWK